MDGCTNWVQKSAAPNYSYACHAVLARINMPVYAQRTNNLISVTRSGRAHFASECWVSQAALWAKPAGPKGKHGVRFSASVSSAMLDSPKTGRRDVT